MLRCKMNRKRKTCLSKNKKLFVNIYTPPVPNYNLFDFFDHKFDHSYYLKIYVKYHFFYCELFYQYKFFKSNLNLTIFV